MTDLRQRISDVLCNRLADLDVAGGRYVADNLTETLMALDGVAIVELPTERIGPLTWPQTFTPHELAPAEMRYFAGKLLAAANAAEAK